MDPAAEAQALADYKAAGIRLHAAGAISLATDTDDDMRGKFEYLKRAGIGVMVAGDPTPEELPRIEKFVKEYDIRVAIHNHGPEDKLWHSPLDVLKAVQGMDARASDAASMWDTRCAPEPTSSRPSTRSGRGSSTCI